MERGRGRTAWSVAAASAVAVVAAVPLAAVNWTELGPDSVYLVNAVVGVFVPFAGAVLLSRRPGNPVGRVLLSAAGLGVSFLGLSWADYAESSRPGAVPGASWAALVGGVAWVPFLALVTLLPLWFPDGRPPGRFWTVAERGVLTLLAALAVLCAIEPRVADGRADNPLVTGPAWTAGAIDALTAAVVLTAVGVCLPAAVLRYRRSGPDGREQQRWFLLGSVLVAVSLLLPAPSPLATSLSGVLTGAALTLVAVAITASVLRHRLDGIDAVVDRTLVYGTLTVLLVTLYLAVVGLVGVLLPSGAAVVGAAVVALALAPVHARLRTMVRRLLYGDRDDPEALRRELARARDELVEALEQERRRLRADLHDGVGPGLAALVLSLDAAAHAARGPDAAAAVPALVDDMKGEVRAMVAELRRVIDELRPPALDELGLRGALDRHLATFRHAGDAPRIRLDCPAELPDLPAAVEVAAYRIVSEAVANVVRHAAARSCDVRLSTGDGAGVLVVEIVDDGSGGAVATAGGTGLESMRDRARALGGAVEISAPDPAGTLVRASLPVRRG